MNLSKFNILKLDGDKAIWCVYLIFILISAVEVFSSMSKVVIDMSGSYGFLLFKHCILLLIGFFVCLLMSRINYVSVSRYLNVLLIFSIGLLCATLIIAVIKHDISSARWITIPHIGQFQPSEIAKYTLIFYLAAKMALKQNDIKTKETFYSLIFPVLIVCALIVLSNFSTAGIIFVTCLLLLFIGGVNRRYLFNVLFVILGAIFLMFAVAKVAPSVISALPRGETWVNRVNSYGSGDYTELTQSNRALMAIATGGVTGKGIGRTTEAPFLNEGHNDFIFAIILEEGGIWFGGIVILLYVILLYRMFKIAGSIESVYGSYACAGMGIVIILQTLINMMVAVGLVPVTGQTLPFISYGGTSFIVASAFLGMVINISKKEEGKLTNKTERRQRNKKVKDENYIGAKEPDNPSDDDDNAANRFEETADDDGNPLDRMNDGINYLNDKIQ